MLAVLIGFTEYLGVFLASWIIWSFLTKAWAANHPDSAPAQGLAALLHA
jgi:hypothetical protein